MHDLINQIYLKIPLNSKITVFELDQVIDIDSIIHNYRNVFSIYHTIVFLC